MIREQGSQKASHSPSSGPRVLAFCFALIVLTTHANAHEYTRVYADENGDTHFSTERLSFTSTDYAPPSPPIDVSTPAKANGMAILKVPAGWFGDFHVAPRRQFVYIISGTAEIGVSTGVYKQIPTGGIVLVEDTSGKGHSTRSIGSEPLILVAVPIEGNVGRRLGDER